MEDGTCNPVSNKADREFRRIKVFHGGASSLVSFAERARKAKEDILGLPEGYLGGLINE